ncbi:unnamed protein product [Chondrus crispus]|uniref:Tc1-like transposase DDE domain-containing protein n=1 Tax=Chondrus crispus TaxID=2769 RepID=R7Q954_CHOCR|nr:unnamed protein product [Chondrus crispus]CDF34343.1 unnamed protein product [Chondrus crispus]|eukprot:XP_005714162.1 unnamed protein product [Chondrus crispus]
MMWACLAGQMRSELAFLVGSQDGQKYVQTLQEYLVPFSEDLPVTWTFMQDGAPGHRSRLAKDWLYDNFVSLLDWPAYSPDLNPIENVWGILVRRVYENQRQFDDVQSLSAGILEAWNGIKTDTLQHLTQSMRKRCVDVVVAKGKKIDY